MSIGFYTSYHSCLLGFYSFKCRYLVTLHATKGDSALPRGMSMMISDDNDDDDDDDDCF